MGIDNLVGNKRVKKLLKMESKKGINSGTYLFAGKTGVNLFEFAKGFAKILNCNEIEDDYCDNCRICRNIDKMVYADLEIIEPEKGIIKVDQVRDMIKEAVQSSYNENSKKVFIIKQADRLKVEAANAILKTIEEPPKDTFFIMLTNDMINILPTIKSRSFIIDFKALSADELKVSKKIFHFFEGNIEDILKFKKELSHEKITEEILEKKVNYTDIGEYLKKYLEPDQETEKNKKENLKYNIKNKTLIINGINDYISKKDKLSDLEKIEFIEIIEKNIGKNRDELKDILYLFILKDKENTELEYLLEIKNSLKYYTNISLVLYNFFLKY
ncbi:MAG: ATPase [Fusobacteriota bacterium]